MKREEAVKALGEFLVTAYENKLHVKVGVPRTDIEVICFDTDQLFLMEQFEPSIGFSSEAISSKVAWLEGHVTIEENQIESADDIPFT